MLCPFCQREVGEFAPSPDGGLHCPLADCVGAEHEVPALYTQDYAAHPPMPVSIFGPAGHGKTVFIEGLLTHLERRSRWPGFSCQWMDETGMAEIRGRLRELRETGRIPDATREIFPRPKVLRLRQVPRIGGCQLLMYDTGGETFRDSERLADAGRYVKNSPAVVWLVSLTELEYAEQLSDLMTVYAQAMARMGADPKKQAVVVALTKGDLLLDRPDLPKTARDFLTDDDLDPAGNAWQRLEAVSDALRDWLLGTEHRNVVNLLTGQFRAVRFCVLSAQGAAARDGTLEMELMPRGVLAPLFWLWRESRPGVWIEGGHTPQLFFDLPSAVAAAPAGATIRLDSGVFPVAGALHLCRQVTIAGPGSAAATVRSTAKDYAVGVKTTGRVELRGLTLAHDGPEPADVIRVLSGTLTLTGCAVRGAASLQPKVPGDGLVAARSAAVELAECVFTGNNGNGVSVRDEAHLIARGCRFEKNGRSGATVTGGAAEFRDCTFAENRNRGMAVTGAARAAAYSCEIAKNRKAGAGAGESAVLTLAGNRIEENGTTGISAADHSRVSVDGDRVARNGQGGLLFSDAAAGGVKGGTFSKNGGPGIGVGGTAAPVLDGNRCIGNAGAGIAYLDAAAGWCLNNTCDGNEREGLRVSGQAAPELGGNSLAGNKGGDLYVAPTASPREFEPRPPDERLPPANGNPGKKTRRGWFG